MSRNLLIAFTFVAGACHVVPAVPTPVAPHAPVAVVTPVVAVAPPSRGPGRADVDMSLARGQPLDEVISTGHEPCDVQPTDGATPIRRGQLLITRSIRPCATSRPGGMGGPAGGGPGI